jgi:hypothetical protein
MKEKSQRLHDDKIHAQRQLKIAKAYGFNIDNPHRFEKTHALTCGDSNCAMCGNPRKFFKEVTTQEKRLFERAKDTD